MTRFETVKAHVSMREAAESYGLSVGRNNMALCPFHNDRNPSLLVADDHYHCFACREHGDVIDFVAMLYGLSLTEAAQKLASDFGIDPDKPIPVSIRRKLKIRTEAQRLRENERLCFSVLNDYLWLLRDWQRQYAPQTPEDIGVPDGTQRSGSVGERTSSEMSELSPQGGSEGYGACEDADRFVEACHKLALTEYRLDTLIQGDSYERGEIVSELMADGYIHKLKARLRKEKHHERACVDR